MIATLTYVYCLVRSVRRPAVPGAPAGLPGGGRVRALELWTAGARASARHWLIVGSVPERQYGERALQQGLQDLDWVGSCALAHEALIERFLSAPAVLPMKLFTIFTSDERAVEHMTRDRRRIARILTRVERKREWGLRVTWDERASRGARADAAGGRSRVPRGAGAAYLSAKRDLRDAARLHLAAARRRADASYRAIARLSSAARRRAGAERPARGSALLLDAAFLVPVPRATAFRAAVRRHAKTLAPSGIVLTLTGPWPPYNFS